MATRMLQRRGTAAEWAAENPVLSSGEMGFETDTKIIKMGDGVTAWNDLGLPYVPTGGGTMTGPLNLIEPTEAAHAARKTDVDARLALSGGTMTGALSLIAPASDNHAARKVDIDSAMAKIIDEDWAAGHRATNESEASFSAHDTVLVIPNPGFACEVYAIQTTRNTKGPAVGEILTNWIVQISLDSGASWTDGRIVSSSVPAPFAGGGSCTAYAHLSGTPTGSIQVRMTSKRDDAETGTVNAYGQGGSVRVVPSRVDAT